MDPLLAFLFLVVILALGFDFINGFHDSANAIATVVSTKVMKPSTAVIYGAVLNFIGALMGTEVAATIGKGLVEASTITLTTVFCTLIGDYLEFADMVEGPADKFIARSHRLSSWRYLYVFISGRQYSLEYSSSENHYPYADLACSRTYGWLCYHDRPDLADL